MSNKKSICNNNNNNNLNRNKGVLQNINIEINIMYNRNKVISFKNSNFQESKIKWD